MFDQIDLITVKQIKNKNGEKIDQEERFTVAVTNETVSRSARSDYNLRGLGRSLKVAGVPLVKSALVTEYINTYVRVRMLHDASEAFRSSEFEREHILLRQLTYGE